MNDLNDSWHIEVQLNVQVKPVDPVVDGGEQKQQLINVECIADFAEAPILTVQFMYVLFPFRHRIRLSVW